MRWVMRLSFGEVAKSVRICAVLGDVFESLFAWCSVHC